MGSSYEEPIYNDVLLGDVMNALDQDVLAQVCKWLESGKSIYLCSVLSTYGSAPRPVGSLFATDGDVRFGSISGGCVEDAFVKLIKEDKLTNSQRTFDYGSHIATEPGNYELPCGGHIQLLIEKLRPVHLANIQLWLEYAKADQDFARLINLKTGEREIFSSAPKNRTDDWVIQNYQQKYQLLLIGISQVSEELARLAHKGNFTVRICDTREEYRNSWHWGIDKGGIEVEWQSPDNFVEKNVTPKTAVLALAHDPRVDDLAMMAGLESDAFYVGALGSTRTNAKRLERLKRIGEYDDATISRLHGPIGLDIGSRTPFEIAIAIMADLIATKNKIILKRI